MKRKKFGMPVGLVALLAVVAMGTMGMAYAAWSSSVDITGAVTTTDLTVDAAVTSVSSPNSGVNCTDTSPDSTLTATASTGPAEFSINSQNLYPGASCAATITLTNTSPFSVSVTAGSVTFAGTSSDFSCSTGVGCVSGSWLSGTLSCVDSTLATSASTTCTLTLALGQDAPNETATETGITASASIDLAQ